MLSWKLDMRLEKEEKKNIEKVTESVTKRKEDKQIMKINSR
jgi:hypothetical protein